MICCNQNIFESVQFIGLNESSNIKVIRTEPVSKSSNELCIYTNAKYKGVNIRCYASKNESEDHINKVLELLDSDRKLLNSLDKEIDKQFEDYLMPLVEEWEVPAKNITELKKLCTMDIVSYDVFKDGSRAFEIWFNGYYKNMSEEFVSYHSYSIYISIKDGKINDIESNLQG